MKKNQRNQEWKNRLRAYVQSHAPGCLSLRRLCLNHLQGSQIKNSDKNCKDHHYKGGN